MTVYYTDDQVTLHHGDALEVARELPNAAADCIVTSPPYFGLRDYGTSGQYGLESSPAEYVETMRGLFTELRRVLADDGTLWLNIGDSYVAGASMTGTKSMRQRLNGSHLRNDTISRGTSDLPPKNLLGIPWRVAFALQDDGWILRNAIIWHKPNAMPESVTDRLSGRYEHVFLFSKSRRYWFDLDAIREPHGLRELSEGGRNPGDVWTLPTQPFSAAHFAVYPIQLPQRCILAGCKLRRCQECGHAPEPIIERNLRQRDLRPDPEGEAKGVPPDEVIPLKNKRAPSGTYTDCGHNAYRAGTVLDPFSGSGTTGLAAQRTGRKYIGIDLNVDYLELSLKTRLTNSTLNFEEPA
ncbi:MAG TPA: site-specific DNA-methyltransferase [Acidobacteriaceae bacterium]|nr:site-specific DNA-methyltransferase [Acidobacteriaceae bacterium]